MVEKNALRNLLIPERVWLITQSSLIDASYSWLPVTAPLVPIITSWFDPPKVTPSSWAMLSLSAVSRDVFFAFSLRSCIYAGHIGFTLSFLVSARWAGTFS